MLTIKLARIGKKKAPHYRFVVIEKARDPWGRGAEIVGHYNPRTNPATIEVKEDRIKYWLSKGVQCTDTVWNLLIDQGIIQGEKRNTAKISNKRREKLGKVAEEKKVAEETAKKKAAEEKAAATEAAQAAEAAAAAGGASKEEAPAEAAAPTEEEVKTEAPEEPKAEEKAAE